MSSPTPLKDLRSLFDQLKQELSYSLNAHHLGKIVAFNAAKGTATVQLVTLRQQGDSQVQYPLLTDCPVLIYQGGAAALTMPVTPGDHCLVLFHDRDMDNWFVSGGVTPANTPRSHDLSDGLVIVGFRPAADPRTPTPSTTDAELEMGGAKVAVGGGKVGIGNNSGQLLTALTDLCTALTSWVDTAGHTPNPATVTAINAAKAKVQAILK